MRQAALFLDRDGVINHDVGHCHLIEDFRWVPGIFETVRTANGLGFAVIVVTNQAGIAKGYYTEADYQRLTGWMRGQFEKSGAPLTDVVHCPYHPDGRPPYNIVSPLRKPAPGMLSLAAVTHRLDLGRSLLIGDQETDIAAGRAAGVRRTALFALHGPRPTQADEVLSGHAQACAWLDREAPGCSFSQEPPVTREG